MDLRVFVCEDAEGIRFFLGDLFESIGGLQAVGSASTEAAAKSWLAINAADWDVVVVDLVLDEGSGFHVITAAKQTHPQGRVVVFSGFATPAVRSHCIGLGADAVFSKSEATNFAAWLSAQSAPRGPRGAP
jgi:two-component system, OmpR family, response regulator